MSHLHTQAISFAIKTIRGMAAVLFASFASEPAPI